MRQIILAVIIRLGLSSKIKGLRSSTGYSRSDEKGFAHFTKCEFMTASYFFFFFNFFTIVHMHTQRAGSFLNRLS